MEKYEEWAIAALTRAVKTAAQTAVALIGTGSIGFTDLDWVQMQCLHETGLQGMLCQILLQWRLCS